MKIGNILSVSEMQEMKRKHRSSAAIDVELRDQILQMKQTGQLVNGSGFTLTFEHEPRKMNKQVLASIAAANVDAFVTKTRGSNTYLYTFGEKPVDGRTGRIVSEEQKLKMQSGRILSKLSKDFAKGMVMLENAASEVQELVYIEQPNLRPQPKMQVVKKARK